MPVSRGDEHMEEVNTVQDGSSGNTSCLYLGDQMGTILTLECLRSCQVIIIATINNNELACSKFVFINKADMLDRRLKDVMALVKQQAQSLLEEFSSKMQVTWWTQK
jgi:hypothetical protein